MAKSGAAKAVRFGPLRRVLDAASGAGLCFGEPVSSGGRTVIPVARMRTTGGWGYGSGPDGDGGGGAGRLEASPVGFIEIDADGTRFERIRPGGTAAAALKGIVAAATVGAGVSAARRIDLRRLRARLAPGRRRRLLGAGRS